MDVDSSESSSILTSVLTETRDGKKSHDPAPHSKEMQRLNKAFGRIHGFSALTNLGGFVAMLLYGVTLAHRIQ
jgi:hypothetical protein